MDEFDLNVKFLNLELMDCKGLFYCEKFKCGLYFRGLRVPWCRDRMLLMSSWWFQDNIRCLHVESKGAL